MKPYGYKTGRYLYKSNRWKQLSRSFLKINQLCTYCFQAGRVTRSTITDHIKPHKGDELLFWDTKNLQPLCKLCHDKHKAMEEKSGVVLGCDGDGIPVDQNHAWNR